MTFDLEAAKRNHPDEYGDGTCNYCDEGRERCVAGPFIAEIERIRRIAEEMGSGVSPECSFYAAEILGIEQ